MNEHERVQVQQRVRALYRYTRALERGEDETAALVLEEAQHDPVLERMVVELNEVYQIKDRAVVHPDDVALGHELLLDAFTHTASDTHTDRENPMTTASSDEAKAPAKLLASNPGQEASVPSGLVEQGKTGVRSVDIRRAKRTSAPAPIRSWRQSRVAVLAATVLLVVMIVPVISAFAPQFLALFRPQQFTAVTSSNFRDPEQIVNNINSLLQQLGEETAPPNLNTQSLVSTLSLSQAEQQVHFAIQLPTTLPPGTGLARLFSITPSSAEAFTFDAAKARLYLQTSGQTGITVPASLDGSSFKLALNASVIVTYYTHCTPPASASRCNGGTPFALTEIPDPTLQAETQASVSELSAFLLTLPKLPADLRTLLQHANIDSGVLPVPLPASASSAQVTVQGAPALLVTLGKAAGIIWETHNVVYIMLTTSASSSQIQGIANSVR